MASCSSCSSASTCASAGHPGGEGCTENVMAQQDAAIARRLGQIRHKIFVMSGKGGVGKSSVTVNVAAALAHRGFKVGIMDVDIHGPSVPNLLGLPSGIDMNEDNSLAPCRYNGNLSVISMDSLLQDRNTAILWRGPKKTAAIRQFVSDVAWGELDFLFIDSPPGTGDEHMTVLKMIPDALCVAVTTPQEISLADVRKAINFLHHAEGKLLGIVENMSGLVCPHCHTEIDLFKKGGGKELASRYGTAFLGEIPLDPVTVVSADRGVPVVFLDQESAAKEAFLHVADAIAAAAEAGKAAIPPAE
ncbi:Mrp/NBP35 family ATP-binding protein [uncultured Desulfovibrio sp.]|uniref:Iron-sulfur cluster carrier protein n=1 Tax=Candidatus Desulfovibrio intestinavium TaxID=2838534 RepID=A0A9D2HNX2_9BACT|nr:Mrp/NBP35 family ATP-binding protein [uncultured Desulfovibrio sp.]HJA78873.1 Mrp/NBP35 family ATP-binding protein [Candidatus Desulfovibrio intestinavium]